MVSMFPFNQFGKDEIKALFDMACITEKQPQEGSVVQFSISQHRAQCQLTSYTIQNWKHSPHMMQLLPWHYFRNPFKFILVLSGGTPHIDDKITGDYKNLSHYVELLWNCTHRNPCETHFYLISFLTVNQLAEEIKHCARKILEYQRFSDWPHPHNFSEIARHWHIVSFCDTLAV